ncbi:MAG: hypothetical protein OXP71_10665 [Candidatus Poribacteria bacterium]|nr:hypothetical protein [Candidatus Poribacteria bacterium]
MLVSLSKWKIVVIGLGVVAAAVFAALLHRQHVVFSQSDGSLEEIATSNYLQDYWWTTVVKGADEELTRLRHISASTSFQSPQSVEALMEAHDINFDTWVDSQKINFSGIDLAKVDRAYPRAEYLQMLLDKGLLIVNGAEYNSFLMYRFNLLHSKQQFFEQPLFGHDADYKNSMLERMGLPADTSPTQFEEARIQHFLETHYYVKEALKDPTFAQQWNEGKFVTIARAKDGTRFPMRADTTYFKLNGNGGVDMGDIVMPAMGLSAQDTDAIMKHLQPFPFAEKLPEHVKIGFIGPDGKPADAPRRGMAKLWVNFAGIFEDDRPEIARSEPGVVHPSEADSQPANAFEPKPVSRSSLWTSASDSAMDDSAPVAAPRHAAPTLEMPDFPEGLEQPIPAPIVPPKLENQMKQAEDWKSPGRVEVNELERLLKSLEDTGDATFVPNVPDDPEMLRDNDVYKDRSESNENRHEFYEGRNDSETKRPESPGKNRR